jgi:integrase
LLGLLAMILDAAGNYGHIDAARNPARGRRRRVKRSTPKRPTVEPEQLPSLLEAAGKLRPMVATMAGAGLRNGETRDLDWPDFDPASGTLTVGASKTDAGVRQVDLPDAPCARNSRPTSSARWQQRGSDVPQPQGATSSGA